MDRFLLEKEIMEKLKGVEGFPEVHDTVLIEDQPLLVMTKLGHNLRSLKERYNNRLSEHSCL
jgi:hypothetical protein